MVKSLREVAEITGFGVRTLRTRCQSGKLRGKQTEDGQWWIEQTELEKLLNRSVEPLFSPREAAAFLSFSEEFIRTKLRDPGDKPAFPGAIKVFGDWRIPERDLAALMVAEAVERETGFSALLQEAGHELAH